MSARVPTVSPARRSLQKPQCTEVGSESEGRSDRNHVADTSGCAGPDRLGAVE